MNDVIIPAETGTQLRFPDWREECRARSLEFRRMSPEDRMRCFSDVLETGMILLRDSPQRDFSERLFREREAEWQRIQSELFANVK